MLKVHAYSYMFIRGYEKRPHIHADMHACIVDLLTCLQGYENACRSACIHAKFMHIFMHYALVGRGAGIQLDPAEDVGVRITSDRGAGGRVHTME